MDEKSIRKLDVNTESENFGRFGKRLLAGLVDILLPLPFPVTANFDYLDKGLQKKIE